MRSKFQIRRLPAHWSQIDASFQLNLTDGVFDRFGACDSTIAPTETIAPSRQKIDHIALIGKIKRGSGQLQTIKSCSSSVSITATSDARDIRGLSSQTFAKKIVSGSRMFEHQAVAKLAELYRIGARTIRQIAIISRDHDEKLCQLAENSEQIGDDLEQVAYMTSVSANDDRRN